MRLYGKLFSATTAIPLRIARTARARPTTTMFSFVITFFLSDGQQKTPPEAPEGFRYRDDRKARIRAITPENGHSYRSMDLIIRPLGRDVKPFDKSSEFFVTKRPRKGRAGGTYGSCLHLLHRITWVVEVPTLLARSDIKRVHTPTITMVTLRVLRTLETRLDDPHIW